MSRQIRYILFAVLEFVLSQVFLPLANLGAVVNPPDEASLARGACSFLLLEDDVIYPEFLAAADDSRVQG
jgi:hypothetical protein